MRIAITGGTGLIGTALADSLERAGHEIVLVSRGRSTPSGRSGRRTVHWNPASGEIDEAGLDGIDAAVNLAGSTIGQRWTVSRKRAIRESRLRGTALIARTVGSLSRPPRVLVVGSGIGYYGDRGDELLDEGSTPGDDFLGRLGQELETTALPASEEGIRVVHLRTAPVLTRRGGMMGRMLLPYRLGLGGPLGSGRQWVSWIAMHDAVAAIERLLFDDSLDGPFNLAAPNPVRNREFARALGRALHRPALLPVPGFALRLLFGEMADQALLASQRVVPRRLLDAAFEFRYPDLPAALEAALRE